MACSICRRKGHNCRTCPRRDTGVYSFEVVQSSVNNSNNQTTSNENLSVDLQNRSNLFNQNSTPAKSSADGLFDTSSVKNTQPDVKNDRNVSEAFSSKQGSNVSMNPFLANQLAQNSLDSSNFTESNIGGFLKPVQKMASGNQEKSENVNTSS